MNLLQPYLEEKSILILDGALATELEQRGADLNDPLWSARVLLEQPELIRAVHADYYRAGADVAITATYQATFEGFAQRGIPNDQAADLMRLAVQLADQARQEFAPNALVAASVGPYGAYLADGSEYRGNYGLTVEALMDFHRPRLAVLAGAVADGNADLLACETIPSAAEAEALCRLLEQEFPVPAWLAFSCRNEAEISEGQSFSDIAARVAQSPQVCAVGINCTAPHFVEPLLRSVADTIDKPMVVYPNSGEGWDAVNKEWIGCEGGEEMAVMAQRWADVGAQLIGGCCRTTPADIQAIQASLRLSL